MGQSLTVRFLVIGVTCLFLGWMAYRGVAKGGIELGIDLKGGTELVFEFNFEGITNKPETLEKAIDVIQQRINGYGMKDINIQPLGDQRFAVQVSATDKDKVEAIKDIITQLGKLEFRITVEPLANENYEAYWQLFQDALAKRIPTEQASRIKPEDLKPEDRTRYPEGLRWYPLSSDQRAERWGERLAKDEKGAQRPWMLCQIDESNTITGDDLENVREGLDQGSSIGSGFAVHFDVKKDSQRRMANLTAWEQAKYMAILLNEAVHSAPVLHDTLSRGGQISGGFTEQKARELAAVLQAGALQEKPSLVSERTIAPDLAGAAKDRGILSLIVSFAVVLAFMVFYYYGSGMLANLALLLNVVLLLGVLAWFDAALTLPGMAGIVLTVGMAVDANILVFERMKEERARGRTVAQAIALGYERALVTIIDSNITTLITAYFLFQIGSGPVRGFGITLAIGIIASMFTALYVTHAVYDLLLRGKRITELKMRGAVNPPQYAWTGPIMRRAVVLSTVAMLVGVVLWETAPDRVRYDLEFTQGSKLVLSFHEQEATERVREKIAEAARSQPDYRDVTVRATTEGVGQSVTGDRSSAFELRSQNVATREQLDRLKATLREIFEGQLLPSKFGNTVHAADGGGVAGEIYFVGEVKRELIEAVLRQFAANEQKGLADATVTALPATPGAASAFRLTFPKDQDPKSVIVNVPAAFLGFNLEAAKEEMKKASTAETSTPAEREAAMRIATALEPLKASDLTPEMFKECDPFPVADLISPSTAEQHRDAAVAAIGLSLIGIIVYVAFRFQSWSYGIAAVVALIHDTVITLGLATLMNWLGLFDVRLNLVTVAAYLTLIGFSINDTIVVFDRIRENRGTSSRARLGEIIDASVSQTLARTIRTNATAWFVVAILLALNYGVNAQLEGFAFVMTFGVIIGTYSSIFIASPMLLYLPWLWEKCGGSGKGLARAALPYVIGTAVLLIANAYMHGPEEFAADWTMPVFNNLLLAAPVGVLVFFLVQFVRFVQQERTEAATATT